MQVGQNLAASSPASGSPSGLSLRTSLLFCAAIAAISATAAFSLPRGYTLALIGDGMQLLLLATANFLSIRNARRSHAQVRGFWLLVSLGTAMWLLSFLLWCIYELWFRREVPDIPIADILLFVKLVPLSCFNIVIFAKCAVVGLVL